MNDAGDCHEYSPQVRTLHLGLMLETRILSVPGYLRPAPDVQESESVEFSFRSRVTEPDAQIQERTTFEKVDRYVLAEHGAAGACRIKLGTPTLVASLTQLSKHEDQSNLPPEFQVIIRVTRTDD